VSTSSLALCFDAPMQSWGTRSRFIVRDTATEPTKSGVVGLLAAALGVPRHDDAGIAALAALRMGVRVDREGLMERDFHTAQNVPSTLGTGHRTIVSHRYYLADALFLVVLEGDSGLLARLRDAVRRPRWPIFFGRKAFVPARPLLASGHDGEPRTGAGLVDRPMDTVLTEHPWLELRHDARKQEVRAIRGAGSVTLRTIVDSPGTGLENELRYDHPVSLAPGDRRFATRAVRVGEVPLTEEMVSPEVSRCS